MRLSKILLVCFILSFLSGCATDSRTTAPQPTEVSVYTEPTATTAAAKSTTEATTEEPTTAITEATQPPTNTVTMVWIPTKGGTKYHKTKTCSNMANPSQVTKDEAIGSGFTPCKKCYK